MSFHRFFFLSFQSFEQYRLELIFYLESPMLLLASRPPEMFKIDQSGINEYFVTIYDDVIKTDEH